MRIKDKKKIREQIEALPREGRGEIKSDVLGSYTGTDIDGEAPVQDADDL